ncbi:MAG: S8 family serine peptidase [Candidatus Aminicenantia bacterium]
MGYLIKRYWLKAGFIFLLLVGGFMTGLSQKEGQFSRIPPRERNFDADKDGIFDNLQVQLATAQVDEEFDIIVLFKDDFPGLDHKKLTHDLKKSLGDFKIKYTYDNIKAFAGKLKKVQIDELKNLSFIKQVEPDLEVKAFMSTASNYYGATKARTDFGVTGNMDGSETTYSKNDVVVAVIDTGIYNNHVDLDGGKVIAWKDYVNGKTYPYDDNGHGTHVSGIIAGTGEGNSSYRGVAPGAALIGLKVLNASGSGSTSNIIAAVDWCITYRNTYNIKVINMSLGSSGSSDGTDTLSQAVNRAYDNGIVPVVAAGNSGPARYTIGSPGAAANAITVGSMADPGEKGFFISSFSSRGPTADGRIKPDIVSPGHNITSCGKTSSTSYVTMSGTSMATPFCAGVVALMIDANPSITPSTVKSILKSTTIDWGPSGADIDFGSGRMQGYEAVKSAGGFSGTGPTVPLHYYASGSLSGQGAYRDHSISVTSTTFPIAVTLIMPNWSSSTNPDFDLYLYNPSNTLVAKSEGTERQETVTYTPTTTGTYKIRVKSYTGSGSYFIDVSANK